MGPISRKRNEGGGGFGKNKGTRGKVGGRKNLTHSRLFFAYGKGGTLKKPGAPAGKNGRKKRKNRLKGGKKGRTLPRTEKRFEKDT